ncbi:MAG: hypothetical protein L6R36_009185 [Xanthoria steineri]|nr:MAG: hypothetical protein L6R36_009185 [Xanthoria steineri]
MEDHPPPAPPPPQPSLPWRIGSALLMGFVGINSRIFMNVANSTEVYGLERFLRTLDRRKDPERRTRGLITVSNHICVMDDPFIWGVLPFSYQLNPNNHRWALAAHDICFTNKVFSTLFSLGQTLPTHRIGHSPLGGLFQPTMTEAVRLMSHPPFTTPYASPTSAPPVDKSLSSPDITDPFSSPNHTYTYSTNGIDTFPAPSAYDTRQYSWIHVFPEGRVHQHPQKMMRYFKWGIARLILEPDECPDIIPMWLEGNDQIMHEAREWPRFVPRINKRCGVWFGDNVGGDGSVIFNELRRQWRELVAEDEKKEGRGFAMGVLSDGLKYGKEAVALREECTRQIRKAVLAVRRKRGLADEDPKQGLVETWRQEGGKKEGKMEDGSWVGRT